MRKRVHWPARGIEKGEREASTIIHSLLLLLLLLVRFVSFQTGEAKGKAEWPIHLMSLSQFCTIQVREMSAVYMYRQNEKSTNIGSRVYEEEGTLIAFFEICALHLLSRLFFFYWSAFSIVFFLFLQTIHPGNRKSFLRVCKYKKGGGKKQTTIFFVREVAVRLRPRKLGLRERPIPPRERGRGRTTIFSQGTTSFPSQPRKTITSFSFLFRATKFPWGRWVGLQYKMYELHIRK